MTGEVASLAWLARRADAWVHSEGAVRLAEALAPIREHLHALLLALGEFHPLPERVIALIDVSVAAEIALTRRSGAGLERSFLWRRRRRRRMRRGTGTWRPRRW